MARVAPAGPLLTAHLFPALDAQLIDLLRSLAPDDWERQTIAPKWKIKDVAAHLLDASRGSLVPVFPVGVGVLVWGALWLRDPRIGTLVGTSKHGADSVTPQLAGFVPRPS